MEDFFLEIFFFFLAASVLLLHSHSFCPVTNCRISASWYIFPETQSFLELNYERHPLTVCVCVCAVFFFKGAVVSSAGFTEKKVVSLIPLSLSVVSVSSAQSPEVWVRIDGWWLNWWVQTVLDERWNSAASFGSSWSKEGGPESQLLLIIKISVTKFFSLL